MIGQKLLHTVAAKAREDSVVSNITSFPRRAKMVYDYLKTRRNGGVVEVEGLRFDTSGTIMDIQSTIGLYRGEYESSERESLKTYFPPHESIIELGACIGVVSCFTNRWLQPSLHVVVEANDQLLQRLERNRSLNDCDFDIVHGFIGYDEDSQFFRNKRIRSSSSHRPGNTAVSVPKMSLEMLAYRHRMQTFNLICDIEGSEIQLIDEEIDFLKTRVAWAMFEFHERISGRDEVTRIQEVLKVNGFVCVNQTQEVQVLRNTTFDKR